ncbi:MAG: hypothetical protein JO125_12750 [Chloroflexi bacterium]|nr:hypothetical protein [Ktedonobacteraceae bacterium]MBV9020478.1 hypothetical protein [Ktedonobacteraceae bacterium]MBV9708266.1 hypothetical protein [Chloroflexota bacterium]
MFYYNRRNWRRNRGFRSLWGWPFIFFLFFLPWHGLFGWLWGIVLIILLVQLIRAFVVPLLSSAGIWGSGSSQNNPSYQQPYQPPQQQEYQPYQQGYQSHQSSAEPYQEGGQQYQYPQQAQYDQYEQPHAQYPQEIPPMEQ